MNSQFNHYTTEQYLKETNARLLAASARSLKDRTPGETRASSRRNEPGRLIVGIPRPNSGTAAFFAVLTALLALQIALLVGI